MHNFLDWAPVPTPAPVLRLLPEFQPKRIPSTTLSRHAASLALGDKGELASVIDKFIEWVDLRWSSDGLFIMSIQRSPQKEESSPDHHQEGMPPALLRRIAEFVSDYVKTEVLGHIHDAHMQYGALPGKGTIVRRLKRLLGNLLWFPSFTNTEHLRTEPVYLGEGESLAGKLTHAGEIFTLKTHNSRTNGTSAQYGCLRLWHRYARKYEQILNLIFDFTRYRDLRARLLFYFAVFGVYITLLIIFFDIAFLHAIFKDKDNILIDIVLYFSSSFDLEKQSFLAISLIIFLFSSIPAFLSIRGVFYIYLIRIPIIKLLRRTIWFYRYTNVYAKIVALRYLDEHTWGSISNDEVGHIANDSRYLNFDDRVYLIDEKLKGDSEAMTTHWRSINLGLVFSGFLLTVLAIFLRLSF